MFNLNLAFEMKCFARESGLFKKVMAYKLCQNANFKNGGTTIQKGILRVLLFFLFLLLYVPSQQLWSFYLTTLFPGQA